VPLLGVVDLQIHVAVPMFLPAASYMLSGHKPGLHTQTRVSLEEIPPTYRAVSEVERTAPFQEAGKATLPGGCWLAVATEAIYLGTKGLPYQDSHLVLVLLPPS
jgi:hypothetical protein